MSYFQQNYTAKENNRLEAQRIVLETLANRIKELESDNAYKDIRIKELTQYITDNKKQEEENVRS